MKVDFLFHSDRHVHKKEADVDFMVQYILFYGIQTFVLIIVRGNVRSVEI